jgi:2-polyprenyl-3-methyl-5-hydroxy-6-metoxy-1,4-benzoquinol methylase
VGCGKGYFLKTAQESGFRATGIDLADAAVQFARQSFGVDAVRLDAKDILRSGEVFDIITGWHVVEHFLDPLQVLRLLRQLLSEDGICFFEVPNLRSLKFTLSRNKWIGGNHPLYHRTFFTQHTLKQMLLEAQFSTVQRVRLSYHVPGRSAAYETAKGVLNRFALDAFLDFVAYK